MAQGEGRRTVLTADVVKAYLGARDDLAPSTIQHYRTVLRAFEALRPELPRSAEEVITFMKGLRAAADSRRPLAVMTRRSYYKALRTFYAWARANRGFSLPGLPYATFGKKRRRW